MQLLSIAAMYHLAWLIRDNRQLLSVIDGYDAEFSNGTLFRDLNSPWIRQLPGNLLNVVNHQFSSGDVLTFNCMSCCGDDY